MKMCLESTGEIDGMFSLISHLLKLMMGMLDLQILLLLMVIQDALSVSMSKNKTLN